jgi:hypothetical protein
MTMATLDPVRAGIGGTWGLTDAAFPKGGDPLT